MVFTSFRTLILQLFARDLSYLSLPLQGFTTKAIDSRCRAGAVPSEGRCAIYRDCVICPLPAALHRHIPRIRAPLGRLGLFYLIDTMSHLVACTAEEFTDRLYFSRIGVDRPHRIHH